MSIKRITISFPKPVKVVLLHILVFSVAIGYFLLINLLGINCPIRYITGIPCPGCGVTRSFIALLSLDFKASFYYHPLTLVILPCAYILIHQRVNPIIRIPKRVRTAIFVIIITLMLCVYFVRLFFGIIP